MKIFAVSFAFFALLSVHAPVHADDKMDGAYLDKPYRNLVHPLRLERAHAAASRSDTERVIGAITPVKNQASRETCSIFSATAMLEAMLILKKGQPNTINLSEEWLEYLITRDKTTDGSNSDSNFAAYLNRGFVDQATWPYIGEEWTSLDSAPLARTRCAELSGDDQTSCLLAHRDPRLLPATDAELGNPRSPLYDQEFESIRDEATKNQGAYLAGGAGSVYVGTTDEVKALLRSGIPVTVDLSFFYGAWNHRLAPTMGINRDLNNWAKGLVGYPAVGSMDRAHSSDQPAGHSVLIVGYDDNYTITTQQLMENGSTKTFTYRGVYFFKNSWGTTNFGATFQTSAQAPVHGGYGAITQKYAEEFGQFFQLPLR